MRRLLSTIASIVALQGLVACAPPGQAEDDPNAGYEDGEPYDENGEPATWVEDAKFDRPRPYTVPENLPALVSPEIIVSLDGLTVHLFDRATGFSRVYPVGVGTLKRGKSITPTGHFTTGADPDDSWWYIDTRWRPSYFDGYPFLRITARNSKGAQTYALHGPIQSSLTRGYVSHGCARMAHDDLIELYFSVKEHPSTPVTIQTEVELDAAGNPVDVDQPVTLWTQSQTVQYGASVGPRT
jgi:lipoprotein-anchoring transpeptidase ErfK/SrfK